jgi:hypothetical protein
MPDSATQENKDEIVLQEKASDETVKREVQKEVDDILFAGCGEFF